LGFSFFMFIYTVFMFIPKKLTPCSDVIDPFPDDS
jgi:hypothetical protein